MLSSELMVYLNDPRHVLIIPATHQDMVLVWSNESHVIAMSMSMLFWWNKNFQYDKDSTLLLIWIRLPHLPFIYFNPVYLQGTCNTIGNFFRADERTFICEYHASKDMYSDGSKPLEPKIWIGESKEFCYPNSISISNQTTSIFPTYKTKWVKAWYQHQFEKWSMLGSTLGLLALSFRPSSRWCWDHTSIYFQNGLHYGEWSKSVQTLFWFQYMMNQ